jgi:triphosphoribosyl-dephospho-CoA synthase
MYEATGGSNSHKGAIWALGLLVAGSELCAGPCRPYAIAQMAGRLARLPDSNALQPSANGARARMTYGVDGATGQAQAGFPHVMKVGLPALWLARSSGIGESFARLDTLMAIMAELDDTCLLHRGGTAALQTARTGAARVLEAGGTSARVGMQRLLQLDAHLLALNASPGGSADLLAATLFLDSATDPSIYPFHHPSFGDSEPWKS